MLAVVAIGGIALLVTGPDDQTSWERLYTLTLGVWVLTGLQALLRLIQPCLMAEQAHPDYRPAWREEAWAAGLAAGMTIAARVGILWLLGISTPPWPP